MRVIAILYMYPENQHAIENAIVNRPGGPWITASSLLRASEMALNWVSSILRSSSLSEDSSLLDPFVLDPPPPQMDETSKSAPATLRYFGRPMSVSQKTMCLKES